MLKLKLVNVEIDRGREVLTVAVPAHEVRVLRAVHGPDKVREAAAQEGDVVAVDGNADAEMARLQARYRRVNAPDPVLAAYPLGASSLLDHGFTLDRAAVAQVPAALAKKHKPAAEPEAPKDKPAKQDK